MIFPFEVRYITIGKSGKKYREVIGVICPSALCMCMGTHHQPIFVSMGDANVDWNTSSAALEILLDRFQTQADTKSTACPLSNPPILNSKA